MAGFLFAGCEQAVEEEEFLMKQSWLLGVYSKTVRILKRYLLEELFLWLFLQSGFSNLPDAVVSIRVDSLRYILKHSKDGLYNAPAGVKARAGKTYELLVSWGGYSAGAITKIPDVGSVGGVLW
ncbi:MAG: hypothetical protein IPI12_14160 [Ignavibacteriales bacterium]|nr:hypothetical protein [Ignavibacteriales bacterium]